MKILLYSDLHLCQYSSIVRSRGEKYSTRLENQIKSLNWINKLAIEKNCDSMICLGDFFDKPDLSSEELSVLKEIKWNTLPKSFLVGNHEMGSNDLQFNSVNALSQIGEVIDKPSMTCGFGYELFYLPYILESDRKPLKDYITQIRKSFYGDMWITQEVKFPIILSHNDLAGIQFGSYISKQGFNIDEINNQCSLFINGHLHNQTQITNKILNLGNLTGQNFSEDGFKYSHCVGILDTDTLKIDLINNPYAFNFYKLEVNTIVELKNLLNQVSNAVITLKIPQGLVSEAKTIIQNYNIIECRIISIPELNKDYTSQEIIKLDHIQEFKKYTIETIGDSDILQEELSNIN